MLLIAADDTQYKSTTVAKSWWHLTVQVYNSRYQIQTQRVKQYNRLYQGQNKTVKEYNGR